jgi:hypothetical protein
MLASVTLIADRPLPAEAVFWRNPSSGRLHVGARIGDGPLLTAEGCQHDQAGDDVVELPAGDAPNVKALVDIVGSDGVLCKVCTEEIE